MNWNNLRGVALDKPQKPALNIRLLEYRIMFIIRQELKDYIPYVQITNNKYGKWDII